MGVPPEVSVACKFTVGTDRISVPSGLIAAVFLLAFLPTAFPYHDQPSSDSRKLKHTLTLRTLRKVDFVGSFLLLVATIFLVAALEEAGTRFPWRSPFVVVLLTVSGLLWILFLVWERYVTAAESSTRSEPVFPFRFVQSRVWIGMML